MSARTISVALPLPLQDTFTYGVPEHLALPERGSRVLVPFGHRRVIGVALGASAADLKGIGLRDVLEIVDESALVMPPLIDLAEWAADHYLAPPGECLRMILPSEGVRASRAVARLLAERTVSASSEIVAMLRSGPLRVSTIARRFGKDPSAHLARLKREGVVAIEQELKSAGFRAAQAAVLEPQAESSRALPRMQQELLDRLRSLGRRALVADLVRDRPALRSALAALRRKGCVRIVEERILRVADEDVSEVWSRKTPTTAQAQAAEDLRASIDARRFETFLLHGVTGSGKTEVYFLAAERALERSLGVLILVPEIILTPMLARAAQARFGVAVAVMHSALSRGERHDQWWRIRDGEARVVIGARSAVFAPIPDLGLIVVDEEHESAYKQEESPRYQARDVAVMRAKLEGATAVLGSATPSIESFANARSGRYRRLDLPERIGPRGMPGVKIVDRRTVLRSGGDPLLTPPLREALADRITRGEQTLLLLNRRGYAQCLLCRECGEQALCPSCSVSLTVHEQGRRMLCHYCGHESLAIRKCRVCGGEYLRLTGYGTERVVEAVQAAFPNARIDRLDRDRIRRKNAAIRLLEEFTVGRIDVLVGTQMIAKGHDFPKVTLVGVIDADVGLGLPDFRSAERTFQLLTQVAGRSGRALLAGEVILQSHLPEHYTLRFACEQNYLGFFENEIEFRRTMGYPPSLALVNLIVSASRLDESRRTAHELARDLRQREGRAFRVLGPAAAPLARLREEHRSQILLKGRRAAMREAVREVLVDRFGKTRWNGITVDVDPMSLM